MATPFTADQPFKENNVINESERDSGTPANDSGKLVQLEADGRISSKFQTSPLDYQEFLVNGTWTKPPTGSMALVEMQAPGGGGAARNAGSRASSTGGNGGQYIAVFIPMYILDSTIAVIVGAAGVGAEIASGVTNTVNGGKGGDCEFGGLVKVEGGLGGVAGTGSNEPAVPTKTYTSDYSIAESVEIIGGRGGSAGGTSVGGTANPGESTKYTGGGGGSAGVGDSDGSAATSVGGVSDNAGSGGDGVYDFVGNDGENYGGGGGATLRRLDNSALMKAGNGGAGYVRVYVF